MLPLQPQYPGGPKCRLLAATLYSKRMHRREHPPFQRAFSNTAQLTHFGVGKKNVPRRVEWGNFCF